MTPNRRRFAPSYPRFPCSYRFHGDEEAAYCAAFGLPYLKAVPMGADADVRDYEQRFADAAGLLLDSHGGNKMGGSGQGFDWAKIPTERRKPLIWPGGLHPGNVAAAIRQVQPHAVDVSSGWKPPRRQDAELMRAFFRGVNDCESRTA